MKSSFLLVVAALLLVGFLVAVDGHSYITSPEPRGMYSFGYTYACRIGGPPEFPVYCPGPCEADYDPRQAIHSVQRGQTITVNWPRNNHAGGFIRFSWLRGDQEETHAAFDGNVQLVTCHETTCCADAGCGDDGGDSNGSDGTVNPCSSQLTIPPHLTDGRWTLQWAWYGGGGGYLGDYYTCVNFNVNGGSAVGPQPQPTFRGGDVSNPGQNLCEFWTTDRAHYCWREPCYDVCDPNTSPTGNCGWPPVNGVGYLNPLSNGNPSTTGVGTTGTTGQAQSSGDSTGNPPVTITVLITVSLPIAPNTLDVTTFTYEIMFVLDLPPAAIDEILVDLDRSTDATTIVSFRITNALRSDGTRVDPVESADLLRQLAESNSDVLRNSLMLRGLQVVIEDEETSSNDGGFIGSTNFIIVCAAAGAVVIIAAVIVIVVVKKKQSASWY